MFFGPLISFVFDPTIKKIMSGFRDDELVELLKTNGIPVADNVTKNTAVLYVDKMDPQRRKIVMANKLNIPVVVYSSIADAVLDAEPDGK